MCWQFMLCSTTANFIHRFSTLVGSRVKHFSWTLQYTGGTGLISHFVFVCVQSNRMRKDGIWSLQFIFSLYLICKENLLYYTLHSGTETSKLVLKWFYLRLLRVMCLVDKEKCQKIQCLMLGFQAWRRCEAFKDRPASEQTVWAGATVSSKRPADEWEKRQEWAVPAPTRQWWASVKVSSSTMYILINELS